jgi:hydroxymethylpyrimidine/phosphomethylpyrimidine kinase
MTETTTRIRVALTIAGSDSSGGAGIQADLKTFQALGVFGMSAVTAVTVQNTQMVHAIQEINPTIVRDQITCLFDDIAIDAIKIGMVSSARVVGAIADALAEVDRPPIVLDPVMISKSGYALLKKDAQDALIGRLFPLAEGVTPTSHEAHRRVGHPSAGIDGMKAAARQSRSLGAAKVVIKGGHMHGALATDILFDGATFRELSRPRLDTPNTHGTGCTFSSAIAAYLARGDRFFEAVEKAKLYITGAIEHALDIGKGHGPTHHFFDLYARSGMELPR